MNSGDFPCRQSVTPFTTINTAKVSLVTYMIDGQELISLNIGACEAGENGST